MIKDIHGVHAPNFYFSTPPPNEDENKYIGFTYDDTENGPDVQLQFWDFSAMRIFYDIVGEHANTEIAIGDEQTGQIKFTPGGEVKLQINVPVVNGTDSISALTVDNTNSIIVGDISGNATFRGNNTVISGAHAVDINGPIVRVNGKEVVMPDLTVKGEDFTTNDGDAGPSSIKFFQLSDQYYKHGKLYSLKIKCRENTNGDYLTTPMYIGIWGSDNPDADFVQLGVSKNKEAQQPAYGASNTWLFDGIDIDTAYIRIVALPEHDSPWPGNSTSAFTSIGVSVKARSADEDQWSYCKAASGANTAFVVACTLSIGERTYTYHAPVKIQAPEEEVYLEDRDNPENSDYSVNLKMLTDILLQQGLITEGGENGLAELQQAYQEAVEGGFSGTMPEWISSLASGLTEEQVELINKLMESRELLFPYVNFSSITTTGPVTAVRIDNPAQHLAPIINGIVFKNVQNNKEDPDDAEQVILVHFSIGNTVVRDDIVISKSRRAEWAAGDDVVFMFENSVQIKSEYTQMLMYIQWTQVAHADPTAVPNAIVQQNVPSVLYNATEASVAWFDTRGSGSTPWQGAFKNKPRNIEFITTNHLQNDILALQTQVSQLQTGMNEMDGRVDVLNTLYTNQQTTLNTFGNNINLLGQNQMKALYYHALNRNDAITSEIAPTIPFPSEQVHVTKGLLAILEKIKGVTDEISEASEPGGFVITSRGVAQILKNYPKVVMLQNESELPSPSQQEHNVFYCVPEE